MRGLKEPVIPANGSGVGVSYSNVNLANVENARNSIEPNLKGSYNSA